MMNDVLTYWRGYAVNWACQAAGDRADCRYSGVKCRAEFQPADQPGMVTSGETEQMASETRSGVL